jgi:anti-anti-sigma factor
MKVVGRKIRANVSGGHVTVGFISSHILDPGHIIAIVREIERTVERSRAKVLILDFSGVQQVSSQMLGQLLHLQKFLIERGGELRVCAMGGHALKAFQLCRLDKAIPLYDTEDDAVAR